MELKQYRFDDIPYLAILLIVPYGIETNLAGGSFWGGRFAFNRTLWNWNRVTFDISFILIVF